ncbi:hypothetical protein NBRC10513v2_003258 [Rhodotorula toruloides]|nr:hypothetical protein AAT19DRAFT_14426 [Rhodotorula toruloides]
MSPSSPNSQSTLTPRACLDSLPAEVKSSIAEMCWLHDEWWRKYSAHLEKQLGGTNHTELEQFLREKREEGGRFGASLGSLALVSQAWAGLTAPFRFRVVRAAKSNRPIFRQRIAWRYLHHAHELHLDNSDKGNFDQILGYLPAFTNLKKLVISDPMIAEFRRRSLFPSHWGLGDAELLARIDLRHLFERIESLVYAVEPDNPVHVLKAAAPSLTSFALRFADVTNGKAILSTLFSTAPHLKSLAIDATGLDLDFGALTPSAGTSWPTLASLSLKAERFNPSLEELLLPLQASIRHLRLEWTEEPAESDDTTFAFPVSPTFLALRVVELVDCGLSPLSPLLDSIKPSNIPELQAVTIVPRFDYEGDWGFAGAGIRDDLHLLCERYGQRCLSLRYYESGDQLTPLSALEARDTFSRQGRSLVMTPVTPYPHLIFYTPEDVAYYDDLDLLKEPIAEVMSFLATWIQRTESSGLPQEYAHLARALRLVELERVAQTP